MCIPQSLWCDNNIDCENGEDEEEDVCRKILLKLPFSELYFIKYYIYAIQFIPINFLEDSTEITSNSCKSEKAVFCDNVTSEYKKYHNYI